MQFNWKWIPISLFIITYITIAIYLFTQSNQGSTPPTPVCKDNQKFLNNSCCDLTRVYKDNSVEKCCNKDLCGNICCGDKDCNVDKCDVKCGGKFCNDTQICDPRLNICQSTYDCNGYDCVITKGGKYTEPTCGSKCPKRPSPPKPAPSSSSISAGAIIGIVIGIIIISLIVGYFMYHRQSSGKNLQYVGIELQNARGFGTFKNQPSIQPSIQPAPGLVPTIITPFGEDEKSFFDSPPKRPNLLNYIKNSK